MESGPLTPHTATFNWSSQLSTHHSSDHERPQPSQHQAPRRFTTPPQARSQQQLSQSRTCGQLQRRGTRPSRIRQHQCRVGQPQRCVLFQVLAFFDCLTMGPSACSFRRMDDPCRAYCNGKSYHRRYSRCNPEYLLDNRQLMLSRSAFLPYHPETPPPRLPPAPTDTTSLQCSYLMFHWVTGIPFGSELHGGAYDDLTLWEQIDGGAQNTPSRKWLFSVPVGLCVFHGFLRSIYQP